MTIRVCRQAGCQLLVADSNDLCVYHRQGPRPRRAAAVKYPMSITLITGPAGSGKTTYARERMQRGDVIVDHDMLFMALSGLDWYDNPKELLGLVLETRESILENLRRATMVRHAWVITTEAKRAKLKDLQGRLGADLVVLDVPADECMRRIMADPRRSEDAEAWAPIIARWWSDWVADGAQ